MWDGWCDLGAEFFATPFTWQMAQGEDEAPRAHTHRQQFRYGSIKGEKSEGPQLTEGGEVRGRVAVRGTDNGCCVRLGQRVRLAAQQVRQHRRSSLIVWQRDVDPVGGCAGASGWVCTTRQ